ncbi:hypothetical protein AAVH_21574 [Aphelenchoides avenae]|nr:hypothetical protein AAVH_21574 [Aphelenchus avenae]
MNAFTNLAISLALILFVLFSACEARPKHSRATIPDYEYRELTEYSDADVFVDSVPLKRAPLTTEQKKHDKTNRLSKLRKFIEARRYYE